MTSGNLADAEITIYKDAFSKEPHQAKLSSVLERIRKGGRSLDTIRKVRAGDAGLKTSLPSICFSGVFKGPREDKALTKHSGLVILDFDKMGFDELNTLLESVKALPFVVSAFISPSGNGLKVLVRIADTTKHRQHYKALMKDFPTLDEKNINEARVCFESFDPNIYINYEAEPYKKYVENQRVSVSEYQTNNDTFNKIEKWIEKKGKYYVSGSRNDFIFTLASACCRFGINQEEVEAIIEQKYLSNDTEFSVRELKAAVKSAYTRNKFDSARFEKETLVDKETIKEVELEPQDGPVKDVIYGSDVYDDAVNIYRHGYVSAELTGIPEIDMHYKWKRGDLTVLTGIGNHGKSTFLKFLMLNKTLLDGSKWAVFGPEDFPAHEFYHDLTETMIGANCTPSNPDKPSEDIYQTAYEYITKHVFYIYPKELAPTPDYIKSRFLKLIMTEKVSGVVIDPFNQMSNDYQISNGRDDKYLETLLSDLSRFAVVNNVYFVIVAHPHKLRKDGGTEYPMPDVFDLAGGAMWNNKADNIIVYHRPNWSKDPTDRTCQFCSKKIRRQKIVGVPGMVEFEYSRSQRRFVFPESQIAKVDLGYRPREAQMTKVANLRDYSQGSKVEDDETPF